MDDVIAIVQLPLVTEFTVNVPAAVGVPSVAALHVAVKATERFAAGVAPPVVTVTVAVSFVAVNAIGVGSCAPFCTKDPV